MGYPSSDSKCPQHAGMKEALDDHEDRLREKNKRLTTLESEVKHMNEKMELLIVQSKEIKASVDSLSSTKTYVMGGLALLGVVYGLLVAHGPALLRIVTGGGA